MEKNSRPDLGPRRAHAVDLLSPERRRVLDAVLDSPSPPTLADLVARSGRHENTVREHLNALRAAGLIGRSAEHSAGRGRPRWRYHPGGMSPHESEYAGLAATLAQLVSDGSSSEEDAVAAGEAWGRDVARSRVPVARGVAADLVALLRERGFAPAVDGTAVRLTRCPLVETAHAFTEVVCTVHLGLARGFQAELGEDPAGTALVPFAEPGACLLVLPGLARGEG